MIRTLCSLPVMAAIVIGLAAPAARADTTLVYAGADGRYTVYLRPGDVRIDDTGTEWQLYHGKDPAILSVSPQTQSYTRLDKDAAGAIRQQMDALRARIEARLQQLPANARPAARAAMAEQVPGLDSRKHSLGLDRTGERGSVAGVSCQIVQIVRDGQPADKMCVASTQALGISNPSFATVKSMFALLQSMLAGTGFETIGLPYQSLSGMPVRFVDSVSGERRALISVSHETLPDSRFEIPDDYIEKAAALPQKQ